MSKVLVLKSSVQGDNSVSNSLIRQFLEQLPAGDQALEVRERDLGVEPAPQLDAARLTALATGPGERDETQQAMVAYADQLINEVQDADLVVIGAPMYNFGIPAGLKNWIDHIARAGVTFRYTEQGPIGLLEGKQVVVMATMGGIHSPGDTDHLRPYLKTVLRFLGLQDIEFITAGALNMGDESRQQSLQLATERLQEVTAQVNSKLMKHRTTREAA